MDDGKQESSLDEMPDQQESPALSDHSLTPNEASPSETDSLVLADEEGVDEAIEEEESVPLLERYFKGVVSLGPKEHYELIGEDAALFAQEECRLALQENGALAFFRAVSFYTIDLLKAVGDVQLDAAIESGEKESSPYKFLMHSLHIVSHMIAHQIAAFTPEIAAFATMDNYTEVLTCLVIVCAILAKRASTNNRIKASIFWTMTSTLIAGHIGWGSNTGLAFIAFFASAVALYSIRTRGIAYLLSKIAGLVGLLPVEAQARYEYVR